MLRIGTAGWSIGAEQRSQFPDKGSVLERYGSRFNCVEINSSFYRTHKPETYKRWADSVPHDFRFSVKVPRSITHNARLINVGEPLDEFLAGTSTMGEKLGGLLVQLPASAAFNAEIADEFFDVFRARYSGHLICEPRHLSWFEPAATALLSHYEVSRVGADPAITAEAAIPVTQQGLAYWRLHGSPRIYYSDYSPDFLARLASKTQDFRAASTWYIFDNTASGAAIGDALLFQQLVTSNPD